ncbi:alpha/beta hydrolase [Gordonia sp. HY285]|uniref:alpha/beta fold hydrolase n=1 Tax=Gordonia liuliyuniae TaxID=2911517 RepID=UPI001F26D4D9|nr:alpha/beta hydrolase [Gordonia liuliyuniae]MCF8611442.1 alpha/beta hydrolase [Gordonia liuliyuniae]
MDVSRLINGHERHTTWITTADGAHLRVCSFGPSDGPVVVLSHGWACSVEYWAPQLELADRYHVVAYDQRGHGQSSSGAREISAGTLADDFACVMDYVAELTGGRRTLTVGHSMGGITLQAWWRDHPDQARTLSSAAILANTTHGDIAAGTRIGAPILNGRRRSHQAIARRLFGAPVRIPRGRASGWAVRRALMNPRVATREHARFVIDVTAACKPRVRAATALMLADIDVLTPESPIDVPATVVVGTADRLTPPSMGLKIADQLDVAGRLDRVVRLDTGHTGNVEAAGPFNAEIRRMADRYLV